MDLNFSQEERQFRAEVRAFIRAHLPPATRDAVRAGRHLSREQVVEWHRILERQGWAAMHWPVALGGTRWDSTRRIMFLEELHLGHAPEPLSFNVTMLGPVLIRFGTEAQKTRFLDRARRLDDWWCQGFSEPGSGSDLASLKTRAQRRGDHYVVNGQKTWTTHGHRADWMFCLVRTDPDQKKQRGISFLLIDMKSAGVSVRPIRTIDGRHELNEVFLDDVKVPIENLVGAENEGWTCAKFLLSNERVSIARCGLTKDRLLHLRERLADRPRQQSPLARKLCLAEVELLALELTQYRLLARPASDGAAGDPMSSILKLLGSEVRQKASELLLELGGEAALIASSANPADDALAHYAENYFGLRAATIYGGSSEVQRNIVAQAVLQLS